MKIRPIILCGGEGTRLWPQSKNNQAKQFIDFGGWTLFGQTLKRIKHRIFDYPIISTNSKYLKIVQQHLKKNKINNYRIVLEPCKRNTAPAILSASLIKEIPKEQPLIFFPADHLISKTKTLYLKINKSSQFLNSENIIIFGIKPNTPSKEYGYFLTKNNENSISKIIKFIEKPSLAKAKKIIKKKAYWNSGMFFLRKESIVNNFIRYQPSIYKNCLNSVIKSKFKNKIYWLNKKSFQSVKSISFDYAILEKIKSIYALILNIHWSDLGNWKEILKIYNKQKSKFFKRKNVYYRPWGRYVNLYRGKNFLIKELTVNSKSSISLQKHNHRSEHWMVTYGKPKITINKKKFFKKVDESIFIPVGSIHRIENLYKKPVKIMEAQTGSILKETDIIRYKDIYGRIN